MMVNPVVVSSNHNKKVVNDDDEKSSTATSSLTTSLTTSRTTTTTRTSTLKSYLRMFVLFTIGLSIFVVYRLKTYSGNPLSYLIPNFFLLTPFKAMSYIWFDKVLVVDRSTIREPIPIPEMNASEYTFEKLRTLTQGFRQPAVVRGMFLDSKAVKMWDQPGYVSSHIGDFDVTVIMNGYHNSTQSEKRFMSFRDAYEEMLSYENSTKYMFFPVKSRFKKDNVSQVLVDDLLTKTLNDMSRQDLEFDRLLWKGFASEQHKGFVGSQFIAGRGLPGRTTGSFWHCAIGNNWFVQVIGAKRWLFVDQKHSALLRPQRHGIANMALGSYKLFKEADYMPKQYVDLYSGDMLYNPDWMWHTIQNHEGLSVGVPVREFNFTLSFQNNFQYSTIVILNFIFAQFGISYGLKQQ